MLPGPLYLLPSCPHTESFSLPAFLKVVQRLSYSPNRFGFSFTSVTPCTFDTTTLTLPIAIKTSCIDCGQFCPCSQFLKLGGSLHCKTKSLGQVNLDFCPPRQAALLRHHLFVCFSGQLWERTRLKEKVAAPLPLLHWFPFSVVSPQTCLERKTWQKEERSTQWCSCTFLLERWGSAANTTKLLIDIHQ